MLTGISLLCFTASYGVALLLEVSRLLFRAPVRFVVTLLFATAGLFAHTVYLGMRAQQGLSGGLPLSSWYEWCLLGAWVLAATYLVLMVRRPESAIGIFLLPVIECLIGVAYLLRLSPPFQRNEALKYWGMLHGVSLLLGTVAVILGFVAGMMYLVQSYRLKHKLPPRAGFKLPSLEWLQQLNERSLVASSLLLLVGIASGAVFNIVNQEADVSWSDPVVLISAGLGVWLIAALMFSGLYRPARQGRKVAYLTVASFIVVMLVLSIVWSTSSHAQVEGKREKGLGDRGQGSGVREQERQSQTLIRSSATFSRREEAHRHVHASLIASSSLPFPLLSTPYSLLPTPYTPAPGASS